ncbi:hypothetical protein [Amycolatopsis anabasis]|nr:hypothetical protein [Amycolatopsis anabasis]
MSRETATIPTRNLLSGELPITTHPTLTGLARPVPSPVHIAWKGDQA